MSGRRGRRAVEEQRLLARRARLASCRPRAPPPPGAVRDADADADADDSTELARTDVAAGIMSKIRRRAGGSPAAPAGAAPLPVRRIELPGRSRSVDCFRIVGRIAEGSFGVVSRAVDRDTGRPVALKRLKIDSREPQLPAHVLREISALRAVRHPNVVGLLEVAVDPETDAVFLALELADTDLNRVLRAMRRQSRLFRVSEAKCLARQLLAGVAALHEAFILHRDIKSANILLGAGGTLKIGDLGSAREWSEPATRCSPFVVTLAYRAPELLLSDGEYPYGPPVDMWSVGCVVAELLTGRQLFHGGGELEQLRLMFELLGTPRAADWPEYPDLPHVRSFNFVAREGAGVASILPRAAESGRGFLCESGADLLAGLLAYNPARRLTAREALAHPWFSQEPAACEPSELPPVAELCRGADVDTDVGAGAGADAGAGAGAGGEAVK